MFTKRSGTWRSSAHSRSLSNYRWFVALAFLTLLLVARQPSNAQTAEAGQVTVTGEPVPTPTPHDNWREMRQHIMPEVSGTEITVTKKATVFRFDGGYVRSDGQRDNSAYDLWQTDLYVGYRPDEHQLLALDFYSSLFSGGDPGRITYKQFL